MFILFSTGAVAFRYVAVEEEVVGMRMWKRRGGGGGGFIDCL